MPPLASDHRRELDKSIVAARSFAEDAARAALQRLALTSDNAPAGIGEESSRLRNQLRVKWRAEGLERLIEEIAYEQWHRMLFARFLAENNLLLHPEGAPVSLAEVKELAAEEGERDPWLLAARYAAQMLPGIFRAQDPANRVAFAPEDRSRLEAVLERLPGAVFTSDDGLGWVYQFWQSQRKAEVNKRGDKIGGADLPAVTQLFTEHYMVRFLLENSLGAWWAGRHPKSPLLKDWEYLRFRDDGNPAAGTFEGWPTTAAEITVMDPCCGSGHFLVSAADMLRKMRTEEEGLSHAQSAAAVIADNLFGLELDARCLQLAAFNLALDAWKAGGYQPLPIPNLACTGIAIKGQRADWQRLAGEDDKMRAALDRLYDLFQNAPDLGSLIDPRSAAGEGLWQVDVDQLLAKLDRALQREQATDPAAAVFGESAAGTAKAAKLLAGRYWLVATNPPFLGFKKLTVSVTSLLLRQYKDGRHDIATAMMLRGLGMDMPHGALVIVLPQNWLFLGSYRALRRWLLSFHQIRSVAVLGEGGFVSSAAAGAMTSLLIAQTTDSLHNSSFASLDVTGDGTPSGKAAGLRTAPLHEADQRAVLASNDARLLPSAQTDGVLLAEFASGLSGIQCGDFARFGRVFWELPHIPDGRWEYLQSTVLDTKPYGGREHAILWERGQGQLEQFARLNRERLHDSHRRGMRAWGRAGVAVSSMRDLPVSLYTGEPFDNNTAVVLPDDVDDLLAIWSYCASSEYAPAVRAIDQKINVTNATLVKVPFDREHWQKLAAEQYPNGLPDPHSDDPTQWLFKGNVVASEAPLQVAVARLLGYRWPDQEPEDMDTLADADGLVPLVSVGGEPPAAERLRMLLARAYGDAWSHQLLERLLAEAGSPGATLETWLRDDFFAQHTKLFHHRPFIWHVWDGLKDGFSVLCHYHRLDRAKLEKLTYTLLGDWIERQRAAGDEPGAEARLAAALGLQDKLKLIIAGENPHDIYVRWKALAEQHNGWEPDHDDGVRLNIRPFVTAGVLRSKVNVKWDKDRGKNPDGSERINNVNLTLVEKRAARAAVGPG